MRLKAPFITTILTFLALGLPAIAQTTQSQSGSSGGAAPATASQAPQPRASSSSSSRSSSDSDSDEAPARSSASADFTGNFQRTATGAGVTDKATYSGGFFLNYRYAFRPRSSVEVNGGFTTFTEYYHPTVYFVQSNVWEATAAYVFRPGASTPGRLKPFLEGGGGVLKFSVIQRGSLGGVTNTHPGAILYGGGFEWRKTPTSHISWRFGYRGLIYHAPQFGIIAQQTHAWTQMAEPFVGFVWQF